MSIIAAGTTTNTALVNTGNTDGTLQLQVNGTTPSVTLATTGAVGVGSTPGYGTNGQVLTSSGSSAAPTWTTAGASLTTPSFTSTIGVGGATASASGAGITFPATLSASSNANTLDDYEEGDWTPVVNGQSQTGQTCRYIKIGKIVQISGDVTFSFTGSSGGSLSGLPFTTQTGSQSAIAIAYTTGGTMTGFVVTENSTTMDLYNQNNGVVFLTGQRFIFTGTYISAN